MSSVYLVDFNLTNDMPAVDSARYDVVDGKVVLTLLPDCTEGLANGAQTMMLGVYDYAHDRRVLPSEGQAFLDALMTQRDSGYSGFQESHQLVDGTGEVRTAHGGAYIKYKAAPGAPIETPTGGDPEPDPGPPPLDPDPA